MTGTALLALTSVQPDTGYHSFWYWLLLMGIGCGLIMSPMTTAIMGTVPAARAGMASATSNTMRQVGSVFGVAVLGNLLWRPVTDHVLLMLHALRLPAAMTGAVAAAVKAGGDAALSKMPAAVRQPVHVAFQAGFTSGLHRTLWVSSVMLFVAAPIAFVTIRGTAPHHVAAREEVARQAAADAEAGARASSEAVEVHS